MEEIIWTDEFSVGNAGIDEQHKRLVAMINRLISIPRVAAGSENIAEILTEMTEYAEVHFEAEEKLMKQVNYPHLDDHIAQHRAFQMKTAALINSASLDAEAVPVVLLNYLRNWLLQHILKSDMAYKSYLA
jgi:hemerythrin-like metal-binding protein